MMNNNIEWHFWLLYFKTKLLFSLCQIAETESVSKCVSFVLSIVFWGNIFLFFKLESYIISDIFIKNLNKTLTNILGSGTDNDQSASSPLFRHSVVVNLPVEGFSILLPSIPGSNFTLVYTKILITGGGNTKADSKI